MSGRSRAAVPGPPRRKPDVIADEMRARIVSGAVAPGAFLGPMEQLVAQYGVARPTMREALRILESERLITVRRGVRGGVVAGAPDAAATALGLLTRLRWGHASVEDVVDARVDIEAGAARMLAERRARARVVAALRRVLDDQAAALDDRERFLAEYARFHALIVTSTRNGALVAIAETLDHVLLGLAPPMTDDAAHPGMSERRVLWANGVVVDLIADGGASQTADFWRCHAARLGATRAIALARARVGVLAGCEPDAPARPARDLREDR